MACPVLRLLHRKRALDVILSVLLISGSNATRRGTNVSVNNILELPYKRDMGTLIVTVVVCANGGESHAQTHVCPRHVLRDEINRSPRTLFVVNGPKKFENSSVIVNVLTTTYGSFLLSLLSTV